jgi:hypothetical protein
LKQNQLKNGRYTTRIWGSAWSGLSTSHVALNISLKKGMHLPTAGIQMQTSLTESIFGSAEKDFSV